MNYSLAICLINDQVSMVGCSFERDGNDKPKRVYHYKTMIPQLHVGDWVVVPDVNTDGYSVVRVEEIDVEPDFDKPYDFKWIVGKVELNDYEKIKELEAQAIERMRQAEKRRRREQLRADLIALDEDGVKSLPVYHHEGDTPDDAA